ncbi:SPOR domain-containing protein [Schleiferia thermophila]|nr:SPOR domain-containing protein [Schleiferia thermophila]
MKNMLHSVTLLLSVFFSTLNSIAQHGHFVVSSTISFLQNSSPLDSREFARYKLNTALTPEIGYQFNDNFYAGAFLSVGILNGADITRYYETTFFSPGVNGRFNFMPLISNRTKVRLEADAGLQVLSFYGTLYNRNSNARLSQVPANRNTLSFGPGGYLGARMAFPVSKSLGVTVGYRWHVLNNPWIDLVKKTTDESFSFIHDVHVDLRLSLENMLKGNEVRVDRKKYQNLNTQLQDLQQNQQRLVASNEARLKEKDDQIVAMAREIDSLRAYIASMPERETDSDMAPAVSSSTRSPGKQVDPMDAVKTKAFRIVVGSFPTQLMAQSYMEKSPLNNPDMFVVYVEDLKTYRVIYKSYPTREAAAKDLGKVRESVKTAWIIYF